MLSPGLLLLLQQLIQSSRQSLAFAALEVGCGIASETCASKKAVLDLTHLLPQVF